jgi:hypothetical protein
MPPWWKHATRQAIAEARFRAMRASARGGPLLHGRGSAAYLGISAVLAAHAICKIMPSIIANIQILHSFRAGKKQ